LSGRGKEDGLAKRGGSYKFEKRQKELAKQKKKQKKLERKHRRVANLEQEESELADEDEPAGGDLVPLDEGDV
jgi:hypothetical protein